MSRLILEILLVMCFMIASAIAIGHSFKVNRYEEALRHIYGIAHSIKTPDGKKIQDIIESAYNG